jgi:opacity protein-like surface antigen
MSRCLIALAIFFASAGSASAQGALVHGAVSALTSDGSTSEAFSAGVAYRFNKVIGFGVEVTHARDLSRSDDVFYPLIAGRSGGFFDFASSGTFFTTNVRLEVPTTLRRVVPFVIAGAGVASISEEFPVYLALTPALTTQLSALGLTSPLYPTIYPPPEPFTTVTTSMTMTLGGGATFLLSDRFGVDVDLRALKVLESGDGRTFGRFGIGASYRF